MGRRTALLTMSLLMSQWSGCTGAAAPRPAVASAAQPGDWPPQGGRLLGVGGGLACGYVHARAEVELETSLRSLDPPATACPPEPPGLATLRPGGDPSGWDVAAMQRAFERASPTLAGCGAGDVTLRIRRSFVSEAAGHSADEISVEAGREDTARCLREALERLEVCPLRNVTSLEWTVRARL